MSVGPVDPAAFITALEKVTEGIRELVEAAGIVTAARTTPPTLKLAPLAPPLDLAAARRARARRRAVPQLPESA